MRQPLIAQHAAVVSSSAEETPAEGEVEMSEAEMSEVEMAEAARAEAAVARWWPSHHASADVPVWSRARKQSVREALEGRAIAAERSHLVL